MTATSYPQAQRFSRSDYKTLGLAALGGALEIYDFIIFVFFALTLSQLFFPPEMPEWLRLLQSFGIFVTGYLARPLGGILMAHFADHLGRKRVFSLSILMMALPCLVIGIMPTYAQIGYFAPLILLAQTRQAARDKAQSDADAQHREALAVANTERQAQAAQTTRQLLELLEQNTKLTEMTKALTERIEGLTSEMHEHFVRKT